LQGFGCAEIPGQILRPLAFLADHSAGGRFVTVNTEVAAKK